MATAEVDAVLARLVAQFGSPYDFLRELAQNSMDAGSDRVEVSLESHPVGDDVVFELAVADTGAGMDETIIDGAFTRLFSSTKADDRTMAGGFGVGFVSVFAWEPEAVLVQTGRAGEAWELVFYPDRTFEKARIDGPFEGTTITLFKRAAMTDYGVTAEAIRDSLWRWCRFCPIEVTFEDFDDGDGAELVQDSPTTGGAVCSLAFDQGDEKLRVAFAVPPRAVLLRRGLILEESTPSRTFPSLPPRTAQHLQVWVDSAELTTTIAREGAVANAGRAGVEKRLLLATGQLRNRVLEELERLAIGDRWTRAEAGRYGALHGHLRMEQDIMGPAWLERPLFRTHQYAREPLGGTRTWSVIELRARLRGRPLLWATHEEDDPRFAVAAAAGLPVLSVEGEPDADWLESIAALVGSQCWRARDLLVVSPLTATADERARALERDLAIVLRRDEGAAIEFGICDALGESADPPLVAERLGQGALIGTAGVGEDVRRLVLDRRHLVVQAALRLHGTRMGPEIAMALGVAVAARIKAAPGPEVVRQNLEQLIERAGRESSSSSEKGDA